MKINYQVNQVSASIQKHSSITGFSFFLSKSSHNGPKCQFYWKSAFFHNNFFFQIMELIQIFTTYIIRFRLKIYTHPFSYINPRLNIKLCMNMTYFKAIINRFFILCNIPEPASSRNQTMILRKATANLHCVGRAICLIAKPKYVMC